MDVFKTFEEFYSWYIEQLEKEVPGYKSMKPAQVHASLNVIPEDEQKQFFEDIRKVIDFPKSIVLTYYPKEYTFASWYNPTKKQVEIIVPTATKFLLRYPPLLKIVIQHELGHIFNRDIFEKIEKGHHECSNVCQDVRINAQLNLEYLEQAVKCIYGFNDTSKGGVHVPHPLNFYDEIGLPLEASGMFDWQTIHAFYHKQDHGDKASKELMDLLADILSGIPQAQGGQGGASGQEGESSSSSSSSGNQPGEAGEGPGGEPGKGAGGKKGAGAAGPGGDKQDGASQGEGGQEGNGSSKPAQQEQGQPKPGNGEAGASGEATASEKQEKSPQEKKREAKRIVKEIESTIESLNTLKEKQPERISSKQRGYIDEKIKELNKLREQAETEVIENSQAAQISES